MLLPLFRDIFVKFTENYLERLKSTKIVHQCEHGRNINE